WLEEMGISVRAHILQIGPVKDQAFDPCAADISSVGPSFPTIDPDAGKAMGEVIASIRKNGDSIGGTIECVVSGLPAGVGEPIFGGIENRLAQILFGIPGVKGVDFGDDILLGSQNNDAFICSDGTIKTATNHCGGILGGISNGMDILFRVRVKPTPSIPTEQQTISLKTGEAVKITVSGRHDPCIVPRAVPVVEAAAAIAIYDMILGNTRTGRRKG
ncbi:MAG: chorismate synthase, partial [Lentisphaeria bacterium]|nr:chorismate synthase [Lentisphaeria bacterium]